MCLQCAARLILLTERAQNFLHLALFKKDSSIREKVSSSQRFLLHSLDQGIEEAAKINLALFYRYGQEDVLLHRIME